MGKYASEVIRQAREWLGKNEKDGSHKAIIDIYNAHTPLARGYKVKYTDAWCATFVSAVAVTLGYTDIIPTECGCEPMINLFKSIGCWVENENRTPNGGDIIFYDWQDSGVGDNTGRSDHVGIVEKVTGGKITVIEGNYKNAVTRRTISVNGRYIRGYGVPKYDVEKQEVAAPAVSTAKKINSNVFEWQKAAVADGYTFPKYGTDGQWGSECASVAKKAICKKQAIGYKNKNLTKIIQGAVGVSADGLFGNNTRNAVKTYQRNNGLTADGVVGLNTWKKILGV